MLFCLFLEYILCKLETKERIIYFIWYYIYKKGDENINKNVRVVIGLIGNIILCFYGVRGLLINEPIPFASYLFTIGGLIGIIALMLELKKKDDT